MTVKLLPKRFLVGVIALGSIVAVSACAQEGANTGATDPAAEAPVPTEEYGAQEDPAASTAPGTTDAGESAGAGGTLVEVAASDESFSTLAQAIEAAGLAETLSQPGPYTVFAPTNEAFEALPEGTLEQLLQPENRDLLAEILTYHVVPEAVTSAEITPGEVTTVQGTPLNVQVDEAGNQVTVNEATVVQPDIQASNGVIHAIDQVILPPQLQAQLSGQSGQP